MSEDMIEVEEENLEDEIPIEEETVIVNTGGIKEVYRGSNTPESNILIWIDTSGTEPTYETKLLTKNNEQFITSDNKNFVLREEI